MATQNFSWWPFRSGRLRAPLRRFRVADRSMEPGLRPGDGLIATNLGAVRPGQVRVFRHPHHRALWLVKRVGDVEPIGDDEGSHSGLKFQAISDNPDIDGVADSRSFGTVDATGTYRVIFRFRAAERR